MRGFDTYYAIRMSEDWDADFVVVRKTLKEVADVIYEVLEEDSIWIDKKDLVAHMKERDKTQFVYVLDTDEFSEIPEHWGLSVIRTYIPKQK